jgi:hypothetical protein
MPTEEEFQALEVRVGEQDKLIKKLTDFLTYQEGSTHETLGTRLAGAMNEMTVRGEESEEKFLAETNKINTSIEQINTEILDIKKLDHIDKQNIDKQHHRINGIEEIKIKELEVKIGATEEKIKESTEAAGQQMPGGASDGTGEPQSGHAGQGDNGEEVKELKEHLGRLQQTVESTALDHADSLARLNAEMQDVKSDQEQKRREDYSWLKWELGETMKSANTGKRRRRERQEQRTPQPKGDDHQQVGGVCEPSGLQTSGREIILAPRDQRMDRCHGATEASEDRGEINRGYARHHHQRGAPQHERELQQDQGGGSSHGRRTTRLPDQEAE